MTVWFTDPSELFRTNKLLNFWPTNLQSPDERINATTRFILYTALLVFLIKKDVKVFIFAAMVLGVLFAMYKTDVISAGEDHRPAVATEKHNSCQLPSFDNPMANVLMSDYEKNPNRPPACYYPSVRQGVKTFLDNTFQYDAGRSRSALPSVQRNAASRQFISAPVSTIPGAQTDFAEWCYGKKNQPMCKDDASMCNPNARGVQLEAFGGLDPNGDMRTGMFGGGNGRPATSY
jgi:hypothetical protein